MSRVSGRTRVSEDDGHKICVAAPAREAVKVNVVGDAGAGSLAQIEAEVEAVGAIDGSQARSAPWARAINSCAVTASKTASESV